jgi:hypothetical protein
MTGHGEKLSRKKEMAIAALLSQPSIPAAARAVKIGEKTLWRWLQREDFRNAYVEARRQVVSQVLAQVQGAMSEAVKTLLDVIRDPTATPSSRVSAARAMIDVGLQGTEVEDLERRIYRLEQNAGRGKKGRW